ncbi:MAG TPA: carboxypeptidase-like regulatory domain-containing protein, partial [Chitinophagaceae bacterium]
MKPTLLALSLLLFISFSTSAQSSVSGIIKDATNNKPIQFATVELFKSSDTTKPVRSGYTSDNGKFSFSGVDTANYLLIVSHTSYGELKQKVDLGKAPVSLDN